MAQFIYTMQKVRKAHGDKVILDDVTLAFLPGAKIGVVGPNGAGKSSVLKIMAGLDQASNGDARLADGCLGRPAAAGAAAGRDEDRARERRGRRRRPARHAGPLRGGRRRRWASPTPTSTSCSPSRASSWRTSSTPRAGSSTAASSRPWTRCAARPATTPVTHLSGGERRRVALCKLLLEAPDLLLLDEPTNHLDAESVQWLEQHLAEVRRRRPRRHPRPVLPGQRRRVDPRARPRPRLPLRGQLLDLPGEEGRAARRPGQEGPEAAKRRLRDELDWVRQNAKGRQTKSKSRLARYEEMAAEAEKTRKLDFEEIQIPPGPRLGNVVVEAQRPRQGLRRRAADGRTCRSRCRAAASSASSARTASARRRCSR